MDEPWGERNVIAGIDPKDPKELRCPRARKCKTAAAFIEDLVSVVVPIYNHERYLRECLDSILADPYPNVEIIAIDDGSNDNSFDVARNWSTENASFFYRCVLIQQQNCGLTPTLNRLIDLSQGEFIVMLASDDYLLPGGILARVTALKRDPAAYAVFADCIVVNGAGGRVYDSGLSGLYGADKLALLEQSTRETELLWRWSAPGPVIMIRRAAYYDPEGVGLYPECSATEDRYLYLALTARGKLAFIDAKVSAYRLHDTNTIKTAYEEILRANIFAERSFLASFNMLGRCGLALSILEASLTLRLAHRESFVFRVARRAVFLVRITIKAAILSYNSRLARKRMASGSAC